VPSSWNPSFWSYPHRRAVAGQHPGLDPVETQDGEPVPDDGRGRLGREASAPRAARDLVPDFGASMLPVEPEQSHRADHLAVLDQLDGPADRLARGLAPLEPLEQSLRLRQGREGRHVVIPGDLGVAQDGQ
jgi:hypothetical protein